MFKNSLFISNTLAFYKEPFRRKRTRNTMSANPPPYTDFSKYSETPPAVASQGNFAPQSMPMPQPGYNQHQHQHQPGFNQQLIYQTQPVPSVTVVTQQPCRHQC